MIVFVSGECIKCYECSSHNDPRCADPFDPYTIGEVDCDLKPKLDHLSNYNATICRKIFQKGDLNTRRREIKISM
jgi:Sleepless protein